MVKSETCWGSLVVPCVCCAMRRRMDDIHSSQCPGSSDDLAVGMGVDDDVYLGSYGEGMGPEHSRLASDRQLQEQLSRQEDSPYSRDDPVVVITLSGERQARAVYGVCGGGACLLSHYCAWDDDDGDDVMKGGEGGLLWSRLEFCTPQRPLSWVYPPPLWLFLQPLSPPATLLCAWPPTLPGPHN